MADVLLFCLKAKKKDFLGFKNIIQYINNWKEDNELLAKINKIHNSDAWKNACTKLQDSLANNPSIVNKSFLDQVNEAFSEGILSKEEKYALDTGIMPEDASIEKFLNAREWLQRGSQKLNIHLSFSEIVSFIEQETNITNEQGALSTSKNLNIENEFAYGVLIPPKKGLLPF